MKRRSRNKRGSMLVLTVFAMFLLVIAIAVLSGFVAMLLAHQRLQDQAEEFEMRAVQVLNESDRTGRINLMTAASRELVFDSRRVYNCVAQNSPAYMPLAQFYLNQSRDGARLIAQEREKILACTLGEMRGLASDMDKSSQLKKLLPWASTNGSSVFNLDLGYSQNEDSNVQATAQDPDLFSFDDQNKSFDRNTKLYHGNSSLRLPGPDDDLDFSLASLPAPVSGTISQARIDRGEKFVATIPMIRKSELLPATGQYIPSRARLTLVEEFQNTLGMSTQQRLEASVSGTTNGACEPAI